MTVPSPLTKLYITAGIWAIILSVVWFVGYLMGVKVNERNLNAEAYIDHVHQKADSDLNRITSRLSAFTLATKNLLNASDRSDIDRMYRLITDAKGPYEIAIYENGNLLVWTENFESVIGISHMREKQLGGNLSLWFTDNFIDLAAYEWLDADGIYRLEVKKRILRWSEQPAQIYYPYIPEQRGTSEYGIYFGNPSQLPEYIYTRPVSALPKAEAYVVMEYEQQQQVMSWGSSSVFYSRFSLIIRIVILGAFITIAFRFRDLIPDSYHFLLTILTCTVIPAFLHASGLITDFSYWLPPSHVVYRLLTETRLIHLLIYGAFLFMGALVLAGKLLDVKRLYGFTWYPRTIAYALTFGLLSGLLHAWLLRTLLTVSSVGRFEVLDLSVLPMMETMLLYIGGGLLSGALLTATVLTAWFLINSEQDHLSWVHPMVAAGFVYTFGLSFWSDPGTFYFREFLFISYIMVFAAAYALALNIFYKKELILYISPFRTIGAGVIFTVLLLYPPFFSSVEKKFDDNMVEIAVTTARQGYLVDRPLYLQSPYRLSMYINGQRSEVSGDYAQGQFPDVRTIQPEYTSLTNDGTEISRMAGPYFGYRQVTHVHNDRIVQIQARKHNFLNHIYAFSRLFFILMATALLSYMLFQVFSNQNIRLFRTHNSFQNKILDTFLLSTFVFLIVVVMVSQRIVESQSIKNIELELNGKLQLYASIYESEASLERISAEAGLDYFLYEGIRLTDFSELSLLEDRLPHPILPYSVYQALINGSHMEMILPVSTRMGNVLIGYKRMDHNEASPVILGIPAVLSSNKYTDQILQSSSLTIVLYIIIFGLFIGGALIITRQIMRPIHQFRSGLQRISAGNLNTTIPVTSQDEIGELANAYNLMVFKLKDLQDELAEKERQTAWAEMARQVAHEIKNPLTPMKLSVQHLHQQVIYGNKAPEEVKEMIRKISQTLVEEIDSLTSIANDFSKFAKPVTEEFHPVDLNHIIRSVMDLYQHDTRTTLYFDASDEPLFIHAASDELKRVFINLIKNSMEALRPGGLILIRSYRFGDFSYVELVDNGSGIPDQLKSKIFIPNFSTKSTGTGLGLAISRKVVDIHKGHIECASAQGLGTTFTLSFPLVSHKESEPEKPETHAA